MVSAIYLLALLCACAAAWKGERTAWALVGSAILTSVLGLASVPFNPFLWAAIDMAVIAAIFLLKKGISVADIFVIALFLPIFALYAANLPYAGAGVNLLVAVQMILTLPFARMWRRAKNTPLPPMRQDDFDLPMVAA